MNPFLFGNVCFDLLSMPYASDVSVAAASSNEPAPWNPRWTRTLQPLMPPAFCGTSRVEDVGSCGLCTECIGNERKKETERCKIQQLFVCRLFVHVSVLFPLAIVLRLKLS